MFFLVDEGRAGGSVIADGLGSVMVVPEAILAWPRAEAKREGALEGRQEALRDVLGKACKAQVAANDVATKVANAGLPELENWMRRVVAGESIAAVVGGAGLLTPERHGPADNTD